MYDFSYIPQRKNSKSRGMERSGKASPESYFIRNRCRSESRSTRKP